MARERRPSQSYTRFLAVRIAVPTALVLGILVFAHFLLQRRSVRWDLTEDHRYTISEGSHRIAAELNDPLTIRAYFSGNLPPRVQPLERQVFDVLEEYVVHSDGKIKLERKDPLEKRTAESEARSYGVSPTALQILEATSVQGLQVWGALVLLYRDRAPVVVDIASRYGRGYEGFSGLEYEISSKIWELTHEKPTIGLTGYLSRQAPPNPYAPPRPGGQAEFTGLRRLLGDGFRVRQIDLKTEALDPGEVPLLLVVRPKEFSDVEIFRLDQYLMKGGRVVVFVTQGTINNPPFPGGRQTWQAFKTGLDEWLAHHGVRVPNEFVCHRQTAYPTEVVVTRREGGFVLQIPRRIPNWFWPIVVRYPDSEEPLIDPTNPATATLRQVQL
ncbi:MAG: GldG family protein [Planctomycetota bacterium]